ncbi:MAG: SagB/ThcOx family dehydrogenase [Desulfobacterales bacterium]|nr:SagB/ThcOx family dehydrogenase [Desulfobacterales bacterium]
MYDYLTRRELIAKIARSLAVIPFSSIFFPGQGKSGKLKNKGEKMNLPKPVTDGNISLEQTIKNRRTIRSFESKPLKIEQLSQLLWAAQGITEDRGFKRAAPSGGALYPMDIYTVAGNNGVENLSPGIYHYAPANHSVKLITEGDLRNDVAGASLWQSWMAKAPVNLVITADYARICSKYGDRGVRYAMLEAGHVGQNIFLQAVAIGMGAGIVGAFDDNKLISIMNIPKSHEPLLAMPVGYEKI